MVNKTFSANQTLQGTREILQNGVSQFKSAQSYTIGQSGTMETYSTPYPHRTATSWQCAKTSSVPALASGRVNRSGGIQEVYASWPLAIPPAYHSAPSAPNSTVAEVLAQTNPSAPVVDLPLFMWELRELPRMLNRLRQESGLHAVADLHIRNEFGWKPFYNDIKQMLDFLVETDRRVTHLSLMYERGGARFRRDTGHTFHTTGPKRVGPLLGNKEAIAWTEANQEVKNWVTVSWRPDHNPRLSVPTLDQVRMRAFRAALGLNLSVDTVWNALPWSWLADYFGNVGSYLTSRRNSVGFVPGNCCIMKTVRKTGRVWVTDLPPGLSVAEGMNSFVEKSRFPSSGGVEAKAGILNNRQIGILAALSILRSR